MQTVSVGGFHNHIIRILRLLRISDERLPCISDISGKDQLFPDIFFINPDFYARRTEKMSDIRKSDLDPLAEVNGLTVSAGNEASHDAVRVLHGIQRLLLFDICASLSLTFTPFIFLLLNVCTVTQHDIAQIRCRFCGKNLSSEASCIQKR